MADFVAAGSKLAKMGGNDEQSEKLERNLKLALMFINLF